MVQFPYLVKFCIEFSRMSDSYAPFTLFSLLLDFLYRLGLSRMLLNVGSLYIIIPVENIAWFYIIIFYGI